MKTMTIILALACGLSAPVALAQGPGQGQQRGPRWAQQDGRNFHNAGDRLRKRDRDPDKCGGDCDRDRTRKGGGGGGRGRGNGGGGGGGRGR